MSKKAYHLNFMTGSFSLKESETYCLRRVRQILRALPLKKGQKPYSVSVRVVGAKPMQALNLRYRKKDRPTDVLSFVTHEVFRAEGVLGDLVVCLPVAKTQAKEVGHRLKDELDVLLVHGVLHLLGFDHEEGAAEAKRMATREKALLKALWGTRKERPASLIARNGVRK